MTKPWQLALFFVLGPFGAGVVVLHHYATRRALQNRINDLGKGF